MSETDINKLKEIDGWTPELYQGYYRQLMPIFKWWYNQPEGYRPVIMGRNISWWIHKGDVRRKCKCRGCPENKDITKESQHMILAQAANDKMSCWICEFNHKRQLSSGWERYYNFYNKILWNINMVESSPGLLSTIRSMYWQPAIRDSRLIDTTTDKSWNEIVALNAVIDIDIINKDKKSIFDKEIWTTLPKLVTDVSEKLDAECIEYKLQFSGNGIYFITKKILESESKKDDETREQFWNIIAWGWSDWIDGELKPLEEINKNFTIDSRQPYTMQFFKAPFSLHQRLDVSAIPISIDLINSMNSEEFQIMCSPEYVLKNANDILNIWK